MRWLDIHYNQREQIQDNLDRFSGQRQVLVFKDENGLISEAYVEPERIDEYVQKGWETVTGIPPND